MTLAVTVYGHIETGYKGLFRYIRLNKYKQYIGRKRTIGFSDWQCQFVIK